MPRSDNDDYETWRVSFAFFFAPIIPASLVGGLLLVPDGAGDLLGRLPQAIFVGGIAGAYGILAAVMFAVPLYLLVKKVSRLTRLACIIGGAVVAYLPLGAIRVTMSIREGKDAILASGDVLLLLLGAIGGAAFWYIGFARVGRETVAPE